MDRGDRSDRTFGFEEAYGEDWDHPDEHKEETGMDMAIDDSGEEAPIDLVAGTTVGGVDEDDEIDRLLGVSAAASARTSRVSMDEEAELDALMRELDDELGESPTESSWTSAAALPSDSVRPEASAGIKHNGHDVRTNDDDAAIDARRKRRLAKRKARMTSDRATPNNTKGQSPVAGSAKTGELDRTQFPLSDVYEEDIQRRADLQRRNSKIYRQAKRLFWEEEEYRKAAEILCTEDYVRVPISAKERSSGEATYRTVEHATVALQVCGFVVLERLFEPSFIAKIREAYEPQFETSMKGMASLDRAELATFETNDAAKRAEKRFEFSNPLEKPWTDHTYMYNPIVRPILQRVIGGIFEIDTFSVVTSVPGAPTQHMHADASPLFESGEALTQLPAHGIV